MISQEKKPYSFEWKDLGDITVGRPNPGQYTRVSVYRLMQFTLRSTLIKEFGEDRANHLFSESGKLAGIEFCKKILNIELKINDFIADLHQKLIDYSIWILNIEKIDAENMNFTLTVSEDL